MDPDVKPALSPRRSLRRSILLGLSLLSGCAAAGAGTPAPFVAAASARPSVAPPTGTAATEALLPEGTASAFLVGRAAGQHGDLDIAADAFLDVLGNDPTNAEIAQQAFLACLLIGRPDALTLAQAQPDNPVARMLLADDAAKRGDWIAAEHGFARLPAQGMTEILAPLLVAWSQAGAGRTDQALATLKPLMTGSRARPIYVLHAALIADLGQRDPEATALYATARGAFADLNLSVARAEASWLARHGDLTGARKVLADLIASSPDFGIVRAGLERHIADPVVRSARDGIGESYVALAASLAAQDAEPAALLLRLALTAQPTLTAAKLLSAQLDEQAGRVSAALTTLRTVKPDDPLAPLAALRRAALLQRDGRGNEALAVLDGLAAEVPDQPTPWVLRGAILRGQNRFTDAVAAYGEAIRRVPAPGRDQWRLFFDRGVTLERAGDWPAAEADFNHALTLWPDQPSVLNYLGYSWTEQGRNLPQAQRMIERAVALQPNDGAILDSLGWVLLRQGEIAGAVRNLERAVELEPEDATINGHLGDAYLAAHRIQEAKFQWLRALTLHPDADEQKRISGRLRDAGETVPVLGEQTSGTAQP